MAMKLKSNKGQAIIEFAFVLPFMMIIVLGIIEFGILFYDKAVITNASREGARVGIEFREGSGSDYWSHAEAQTAVQSAIDNYLASNLISFWGAGASSATLVRGNDGISPHYGGNGTAEVLVTYQHRFMAFPKFANWNGTINIGAKTIMRLE